MKYSMFLLIALSFSLNAFADLKVTNADGWKLNFVKDDKMFQYIVPGAEYALTKDLDKEKQAESDGMVITIRKVSKQSGEELASKKSAWLHAIFSPERLKKIHTSDERQAILKVDGEWRYVAEIDYDSDTETPLHEAILGLKVNGDLYLVMYEHRGQVYRRNRKEALELLKKIKIEVSADEAPAKSK
jgi:hypothetical protein